MQTYAHLYWPYKLAAMLLVGAALSISLLAYYTQKRLQRLCVRPYLSPNWLSLWRAPVVTIGLTLYLIARLFDEVLLQILLHWSGYLIVVYGLTGDRIDGAGAKSLIAKLLRIPAEAFLPHPTDPTRADFGLTWAWWTEKRRRQEDGEIEEITERVIIEPWVLRLTKALPGDDPKERTKLPMFRIETVQDKEGEKPACAKPGELRLVLTGMGGYIDPAVDKINFDPTFIILAFFFHVMSPLLSVLMALIDGLSTVLREPFTSRWPRLKTLIWESDATFFGKAKVVAQFISLLAVIPATMGWLNQAELAQSYEIASRFLGIAVIGGGLSILSRLVWTEWVLRKLGLLRVFAKLQGITAHHMKKRRLKKAAKKAAKEQKKAQKKERGPVSKAARRAAKKARNSAA